MKINAANIYAKFEPPKIEYFSADGPVPPRWARVAHEANSSQIRVSLYCLQDAVSVYSKTGGQISHTDAPRQALKMISHFAHEA